MKSSEDLLTELIFPKKSKPVEFSLTVKKNQYRLDDVVIFKKNLPIKEKMVENIAENFIYQIKAVVQDPKLAKTLSSVMLGPNYKFEELEICISSAVNDLNKTLLLVNLINSIQKKSSVELTMNIVKVIQK